MRAELQRERETERRSMGIRIDDGSSLKLAAVFQLGLDCARS